MDRPSSLFDRFISQKRPASLYLGVSLFLLLFPFVASYLDGDLDVFIRQGQWRIFLLPPVISIYIWLISPHMARLGDEVIGDIRPLLPLEDESFERLVRESSRINPIHEAVAFGIGVILGITAALASGFGENFLWLGLYWFFSSGLMYGLLAWTIFVSVASTRLNAVLFRQPLRIDILDLKPFEAVGRQGLLLALVFVGGITFSFILSFQLQNLSSLEFWLVYLIMVLATVLIFFLSMRPTHQVLAEAKKGELEQVQRHIQLACRDLVRRLDQNQDPAGLAPQINALVAFEQRLQAASTWPYNTPILRTLFVSVLVPLGTALVKLFLDTLLP